MGDRRISDRRAPEEGVVKIKTNKLIVYIIVGIILLISVLGNIILGILYGNYKKNYESVMESNSIEDYFDDEVEESEANSEYNCDLLITGDKEQIKAGESVTYEIKAENINAGSGIVMFETLLDYDTEAFECEIVKDENSEWTESLFVEDYLTMSRKDLVASTENQSIVKITFKAKEDIEAGEHVIDFNQIKFTMDEEKTFSVLDESVVINVINNE